MLKEYTLLAIGSLRKRFLRTLLTMIGIFIGIAAVVALISLGQGMQEAVNQQFAGVGADKIIVQGASATLGPPGQNTAGKISNHDLEIVKRVPGVDRAAGRILRSVSLEYADEITVTMAASIPEEQEARQLVIEANNINTAKGRMLKPEDNNKIIVGHHLWTTEHFPKPLQVGSKILVNNKQFEIVGLLNKIGAGRDEAIMMNEKDLREMAGDELSVIVAQTKENPANVADKILRAIRKDRHQKEGFEDVTVSTSEDIISSINTILGVIQAVFIGIAAISLIVGGVGIMNTMYTSVLERTKEIGIMKAIGARNKDVLMIFLLESAMLGLTGGAIGLLIGAGLSKLVEWVGQAFIGAVLKASFPWYLIAGALAFSFTVGAVSGLLPARQAAKLPPVEALRGD